MSLDIWTQCAEHEVETFHSTVFRSVVPGAGNTTRKYVDSGSEHDALEAEFDGHNVGCGLYVPRLIFSRRSFRFSSSIVPYFSFVMYTSHLPYFCQASGMLP